MDLAHDHIHDLSVGPFLLAYTFGVAACMQAAIRAAAQEVARGVSTGVVVWAGSRPNSCSCTCPESPACNCYYGERAASSLGWSTSALGAAFSGGVVLGAVVVILVLRAATVVGRPYIPPLAGGESSPKFVSIEEEAAEELRELRRRRNGVRNLPDR